MLSALLTVVLPVAFVAGVGAIVARFVKIEAQTLARLSLYALSPALVLDTFLHTTVELAAATRVIGGYLLSIAIAGAVAGFAARRFESRTRRSVIASVMIGNNGNFGLPVALFALGAAGFQYGLMIFLASVLVTFTVGPALYGGGGGLGGSLRAVLRLPILWVGLFGVILRLLDVQLPTGLDRGVSLLAEATLPLLLVSLGVQIGTGGMPRLNPPLVTASALRLLAGPLAAVLAGFIVGARGLEAQSLVLAAAMPTAVNAYLLATEFDADAPTVAGAVVITTIGSLATIAAVVALLPYIGR